MTPTRETWRPVVGYEGYYEVSDHGRVRSVDRRVHAGPHGGGGSTLRRGHIKRPQIRTGRQHLVLYRDGKGSLRSVYSLVLEAFVGPRPDGCVACHNDGDPMNDRLSNLRWDTQSNNIKDAVRHGTHPETRKTRCPRGHCLTEPNLDRFFLKRGLRKCLACTRSRTAGYRAVAAGQPFDFSENVAQRYARIMEAADY